MIKRIAVLSVLIILIILLGLFSGIFNFSFLSSSEEKEHRIVLEKMEELGKLELVKFNINDVVEETVVRKLFDIDKLAPDSKVLLIINGEAAGGVDLTRLRKEDIHFNEDVLYIELPAPEIAYARINHERSKIYDMNFTARLFDPDIIEKAYKNAESMIAEEAVNLGLYEQTKQNAVKFINALLQGYIKNKIQISFKESDIKSLQPWEK